MHKETVLPMQKHLAVLKARYACPNPAASIKAAMLFTLLWERTLEKGPWGKGEGQRPNQTYKDPRQAAEVSKPPALPHGVSKA